MKKAFIRRALRLQFGLLVGLLLSVGGMFYTPQKATAQSAGFCSNEFYMTSEDQAFRHLEPVPGTFPQISDLGRNVDATGYNVNDGLIYGLDDLENLVSIDPSTGSLNQVNSSPLTNVSDPSRTLSDEFVNSGILHSQFGLGDVADGFLYASVGEDDRGDVNTDQQIADIRAVFKIDLTALTYERLDITYDEALFLGGDYVYRDGKLYSIDGKNIVREDRLNAKLVVIDLDTQTGTVIKDWNNAVLPRLYEYDSQWLAKHDSGEYRMYTYHNESERIYEIDDFMSADPVINWVKVDTQVLEDLDGASCPDAPVPDWDVDAKDDVTSTEHSDRVLVDVLSNDLYSAQVTLAHCSLSTDLSPANGVAEVNLDNTVSYTPDPAFIGPDSFRYTVCDQSGEHPDTATVEIEVLGPELSLSLDDSVDSLALNEQATAVLSVTNSGYGEARDVVVSLTIPNGLQFVSTDLGTYDDTTRVLSYTVPTPLAAGDSFDINVTYELIDDSADEFTLEAELTDDMAANLNADDTNTIEKPEDSGNVLGAVTSGEPGQVLSDHDTLSETGIPTFVPTIIAIALLATAWYIIPKKLQYIYRA